MDCPTIYIQIKIIPGQHLNEFGIFDFIYCWSVFEHVKISLLETAFQTLSNALTEDGVIFLQVSPLFYSRDGSHLAPWIQKPWGHLSMEMDAFRSDLFNAPPTPEELRQAWSVYIPLDASATVEREILWDTYVTLNKVTAPHLECAARSAGLEIVRDYRTFNHDPIPIELLEIFHESVLRTEQVVWLLKKA